MNAPNRSAQKHAPLSYLSSAIILALSTFCGCTQAASNITAGNGENKTAIGEIAATTMDDAALDAHAGGRITGKKVVLSSKFGALIRASGLSYIELEGVTMGPSFGAQAYIKDGAVVSLSDATFTVGDVLYVDGKGSQLLLRNSTSLPTGVAFDIRNNGSLQFDNVTLEGTPSGSGAAMIRVANDANVSVKGSHLTAHDNAVLKLSDGATAILRDSQFATNPEHPENMGYYPVIQLNQGTFLDVDNVDLDFTAEGSALSLDDNTVSDIRNSRIIGSFIKDAGAAVDAFGTGSKIKLTDTDIHISGDMSGKPGKFMGVYGGTGASVSMLGGNITTQGNGLSGLQADYADTHLTDVAISTLQENSPGVVLLGAFGDIYGGTILTQSDNSPAISLYDRGSLTISGTNIRTQSSPALEMYGESKGPLALVLDNALITGGNGTSLIMRDSYKGQSGSADVIAKLRSGTVMTGDVNVEGKDTGSLFGLDIDNSTLTGALKSGGGHTSLTTTNGGAWNITGISELDSLSNGGTVNFAGDAPGISLHVRGDYAGNNGLMMFRTVLSGDNSPTDHMTVDGSTQGTTRVAVTNSGGSGAKTLDGIELIRVNGESVGEFQQQGRIVAGAYDYSLVRGQGTNAGNWYLTSEEVTPGPGPDDDNKPDKPDDDNKPDKPDDNNKPDKPDDNNKPDKPPVPHNEPAVRPEAAAYAANMTASNTLFQNRLHDRLGETHYVDALTGEEKVTSLWMRHVGGHKRSKDGSGQLSTQANRYVLQLGGDIAQWSIGNQSRFHLGVMGGYANQKSRTRSYRTGYHANGSIHGYSAGLYGTWLQDNEAKTGAYVDSWMLYNWFDNSVSGQSLSSENYKSKGITASIETGYTWKVAERSVHESWYIQPLAQLTWMDVTADIHHEANGTRVQGEGAGNLQSRLGFRTFIKGHSAMDDGKGRMFQPFVEANWLHNTKTFGAKLDGARIDQAGTRNVAELKTGVEGQLNQQISLWVNVSQQIGNEGYSDTSGMLGLKVSF